MPTFSTVERRYTIRVRRTALLVSCLLACACVERRLFVRTDPPGAKIRVNGADAGVSPTSWRFDHYGTVLVEADLSGYEAEELTLRLRAPWYQRPGIDFFADVVYPGRIRDEHEVVLKLRPLPRLTAEEIERELKGLTERARKARAR